jgi:hypothetical protein
MNKRFLRRRFLVDRKLQGSICAHGLLYGGLVLVAVSCGIFAPLLWDLSGGGPFVGYEDQAIVMIYMHERFWSLAALCFLVIGLGSLKFSHRIAGPLVRYKRNLRLIAQGKLPPPLRTRPDDYLKEEVVCLNEAVAGVRQRIDAIREAQVAVAREIQAVVARSPRQASALLEPLVVAGQQLERTIGAFEHHDTRDDRIATETEPGQTMFAFAVPGGGS